MESSSHHMLSFDGMMHTGFKILGYLILQMNTLHL